jgi:hypothetical protein
LAAASLPAAAGAAAVAAGAAVVVVAGAAGVFAGVAASGDGTVAAADASSLALCATAALPTSSAEAIQPASKILLVAVTLPRPCSSAGGRLSNLALPDRGQPIKRATVFHTPNEPRSFSVTNTINANRSASPERNAQSWMPEPTGRRRTASIA